MSKSMVQRSGLLLWGAFYALVALVLCAELFLPGRSLFRWDTLFYNWPVALETRAQLLAGQWPFWTDSFCCGTPLLENINAGVLYPPRLLIWLLPLWLGYSLFLAFHVWLALVGMHAFVARMGGRADAAVAGALMFGASGYARAMWDTHNFVALPWLPLGLSCLLDGRREHPERAVVCTALCWSMLLLGGDVQAAALWPAVAGLLALLLPERRRLLLTLFASTVLALALSAAQWLPTLDAVRDSYRAGGLDSVEALSRSFHPLRLLELFLPYAYGNRDHWFAHPLVGGGGSISIPWTCSIHMGVFAVPLAVLAASRRRSPAVVWALILAVISGLLSFGRFLPGFGLWRSLPLIEAFRYPEKYLLWLTLALSLLGGLGAGRLIALGRSEALRALQYRWLLASSAAVLAAAGAATAVVFAVSNNAAQGWWLLLGWGIALGGYLAFRFARRPAGICAAIGFTLLVPWQMERPTSAHQRLVREPPAYARVLRERAQGQGGRFFLDPSLRRAPIPPGIADLRFSEALAVFFKEKGSFSSPVLWGFDTAGGFSPLESGAMRALRPVREGVGTEAGVAAQRLASYCRSAAVRWLLTSPERAGELESVGLTGTTLASWDDPATVVLLEFDAVYASPGNSEVPGPRVSSVRHPRPGSLRIDLVPGAEGSIRTAGTYARGWHASDGQGAPLVTYPLDDAFLAVRVPSGTTQVRLQYTPPLWRAAAAVSLIGLATLLGLSAFAWRAALRRQATEVAAVPRR